MGIWLLTPPYQEWQAHVDLPGTALPLGSILFERHTAFTGPLLRRQSPAVVPHVPRIIAATRDDGYRTEYCATGLPTQGEISSVFISGALHPPSPPLAIRMIRERTAPSPRLIADWFADRLRAHWILPRVLLLAASVCRGCESGAGGGAVFGGSPRNLRHHAHRWLNCRYRDFQSVLLLALARRPLPRVKDLPDLTGVSLPRLRGRVIRLLGVSLSDYNACPGWEWVFESALRQRIIQAGEPDARESVCGGSLRRLMEDPATW